MKPFLILLTMLGLFACNTIEGAGEDIEAGGEAIKEQSRETQREM